MEWEDFNFTEAQGSLLVTDGYASRNRAIQPRQAVETIIALRVLLGLLNSSLVLVVA